MDNQLRIYPNPTTGEIVIQSSKLKVQSVEIFDVSGKKQSSHHLNISSPNQIDISDFPTGAYFLRIATEQGVVTKKIIKQ